MLKLNVNQEKQLNFEIQIGGVQSDQVSSHLRVEIDGIEYGFPAKVGQESITVDLPALKSVTARKLKQGEEVNVRLEIVADGQYLTPWSDTFILSNPLMVEAKIIDDDFKTKPSFKTTLVTKGNSGDREQGVVIEKVEEETEIDPEPKTESINEEEITEKIFNKLSEKFNNFFDDKEEKPVEKKEVIKETKTPKKISRKALLNITEEEVYNYMTRAGTANPKIQQLIYEQATAAAKSGKPVEVLKQVVKILKKK